LIGSVTQSLFKFFRRGGSSGEGSQPRELAIRSRRHSTAFKEFMRSVGKEEGLSFLDLGSTSATNISLLTERGHKLRTEDLLGSSFEPEFYVAGEGGAKVIEVDRFLKDNLQFHGQQFDAVFFWDIADYLPEPLVKPVIEKIFLSMKPGGMLLAFFHTKDAGPDAPYSRYHIVGEDSLDLQPVMVRNGSGGSSLVKLQRVFNNRHIENLFRDYASLKFFLARDNMREVLVVR
jgi:SAM-dependent methyltransferase